MPNVDGRRAPRQNLLAAAVAVTGAGLAALIAITGPESRWARSGGRFFAKD